MKVKLMEEFWCWFNHNRKAFENDQIHHQWFDAMNVMLLNLGVPSWEIGPGSVKNFAFVISPSGDQNLLPLTKGMVALAPNLDDWEFHATKPRKNWHPVISIHESVIDAQGWCYGLEPFPEGTFNINILAPNLEGFDHLRRCVVVETVLDGMLGEALRIEKILEIRVFVCPDDIGASRFSAINTLFHQLQSKLNIDSF